MKQSDKSGSPSIEKSTSAQQPPQPPNQGPTTGPTTLSTNESDLSVEQREGTVSEASETPLSTAPTSPLSNTSSSYKSGTFIDDTNLAQGLQSVDNGEPQISERAAYGEQMVGYLIIFPGMLCIDFHLLLTQELLDTSKKVQFDNKRPNDKKFVIGSFPLGSDDQDEDELYINSERDRQRRKS